MSQATHDEMRTALAAEALGALEGDERRELLAHVVACDGCRRELESLRGTAVALGEAVPPVRLDPDRAARLRARLVARAAAEVASQRIRVDELAPRREAGPPVGRRVGGGWVAAASVVLVLGVGGYALTLRREVQSLRGRVVAAEAVRAELRGELAVRDRTLSELAGRGVRVIELASAGPRAPSGRMFWNPRSGAWTFFAHDLPPVRPDRAYQLWLVTPGRKLSAGTFTPGADGAAVVRTRYDLPPDSLRAVAVTEEPAGGAAQPTGPMVIAGALSE